MPAAKDCYARPRLLRGEQIGGSETKAACGAVTTSSATRSPRNALTSAGWMSSPIDRSTSIRSAQFVEYFECAQCYQAQSRELRPARSPASNLTTYNLLLRHHIIPDSTYSPPAIACFALSGSCRRGGARESGRCVYVATHRNAPPSYRITSPRAVEQDNSTASLHEESTSIAL